jgi:hypothetical protein
METQPVRQPSGSPRRSLEVEHWQQSFRSTPVQLWAGILSAGLLLPSSRPISCRLPSTRRVTGHSSGSVWLMSGLNVVGVLAVGRWQTAADAEPAGLVYALRAVPTPPLARPRSGACGALS